MRVHLFIAGVPSTGKSLLGKWLAAERGWMHIDAEHWPDYDSDGIHAAWDEFLMKTGRAMDFIRAVSPKARPMIFDWGLPMRELFVVVALQAEGVATWWLCGEGDHARKAFIKREEKKPDNERVPVERFDAQMREIDRHWLLIERLFGDHMINGLEPDGAQRKPAVLWEELRSRDKRLRDSFPFNA
jgi:hypothetical protein